MVVERIPGEIMYIDWAGDTLELVATEETGVLQKAHFFITTIGVSSYCFAMAFPNEKTENFLQGTVHALHFYGGAPKILKPDNTKAASIKNTKDVLILNSAYADLQDYYKVVVVPAPPGKPRGKASVENHVRWLEIHLIGRLRSQSFSSFAELNAEILNIINELNTYIKRNEGGTRKELFEKFDKPCLRPLPDRALSLYVYCVRRVPNNYHVEWDHHYYSVPYTYYKQQVTLKCSAFEILICDSSNQLICRHERLAKPFPKYSTIQEHMPSIPSVLPYTEFIRWKCLQEVGQILR